MWQSKKTHFSDTVANVVYNGKNSFDFLFLHGFLENATMWKPVVEQLKSEISFCAPDLPGHGKSEMLTSEPDIRNVANWLKPILEKNGRPVFVVAHSLGGYVALEMARIYPELINGIFLVHSTTTADSDERKASRDQGKRVLKMDRDRYLKTSIEGLFLEKLKQSLEKEIDDMVRDARAMDDDNIIWYLEAMKVRRSNVEFISLRDFPLIQFAGKYDPILPVSLFEKEVAITKPEKTFLTEAAGHMSHLESPEKLATALDWSIDHFGRGN